MKKFIKIFWKALLVLLIFIMALFLFAKSEWGQNWLASQVTKRLSTELKSKISIKQYSISFFNRMSLEGVLVKDQQQDTLLYAGKINVRITDWFFLKNKADLKYIGLENTLVKLQRTDSTWNYRFFEDYFFPPFGEKTKKEEIEFNLKKVDLKNIYIEKKDRWLGEDRSVRLASLSLDANKINFSSKNADVKSIDIIRPLFSIYNYPKIKPASPAKPETQNNLPIVIDSILIWNKLGWNVFIGRITLKDGIIKTGRQTVEPPTKHFDGKHIEFAKIQGDLRNVRLKNDSITAKLNLKATERSGLEVKSLLADWKFHPKGMEFHDFELKTNKSTLKNYFAMKYNDLSDMNGYIHKVIMEANFSEADIDSDDIAYFAPAIKTWNKKIKISGKASGTVDDLKLQDLIVQAGGSTYLSGDVSLSGLPDIDKTFIDFTANKFSTTYNDAVKFIPALKKVTTPDFQKLNYLRFNGNFTGFIRDFVTFGTIQTNLGTINSDLNMKFPKNKEPFYSGHISSGNFQLGDFLKNQSLGAIAFNGEVKGSSFKWNSLNADLDGIISMIDYNGYRYQNIITKATFNQRNFKGDFLINDPNLVLSLSGLIDFNKEQPEFNLVSEVSKAQLKLLNLTKENLAFNGNFDLQFTGSSIDNFLGEIKIREASLFKDDTRLSFDSLIVSSELSNGIKTLKALSNEFEGNITGNFNIENLPIAFQYFLNRYYPAYIKQPEEQLKNESFSFDFKTQFVEEYVKLINKDIEGFNYSHIKGDLNFEESHLSLNVDVPYFAFQQYKFNNTKIEGLGNLDSLVLNGMIENIQINDNLSLPVSTFHIRSQNDLSNVSINSSANQSINNASLKARVQTLSDGVKIVFDSSYFVLNGKTWNIEKDGDLQFRKNYVAHGEVILKESLQEIHFQTSPSEIGGWNDLNVNLQNINIGDFSPFFLKKNRLEGLLSGTITIEDPAQRMNIVGEISTDQLRLDDDSIGQTRSSFSYNNKTGELTGKGGNKDPLHKIAFDLALFLKESSTEKNDRITLGLENYPIKMLEQFIGVLFSDLEGYATGKLDIVGRAGEQQFIGKARLHNAGLKVNFTQCFYKIDDTDIELTPRSIKLGTIKLRDRFGKTATVNGTINHQSFRKMVYDIHAKIDEQPFEVLNTTYIHNKQFYGTAKGTGTLSFTGPESNMIMNINAKASEQDSSYITIPFTESRESGIADFLVERKYGREMTKEDISGRETNISYNVDLTANQMVNVKVILDDLTGDEIKGRGDGTIKISAGTTEPLSIRGRYNITDGNYLFTFQSFFKRDFELVKNAGNFIEWSGDPYKAKINFEARYKADNVSFAPLVKSLNLENSYVNFRDDVFIVAHLYNELFDPKFTFRLEFPAASPANTDPNLSFNIRQIENNPNEINKQVTYLIVFNSFAQIENNNLTSSTLGEFATTTLSGIFSGEINKQLNQILSRIFKNNDDFRFNFSGSFYNRNPLDPDNKTGLNLNQANLNVSVGQSLFKDRFIITFGSGFDVPLQPGTNTQPINFQFLPDVTAEWLINEKGNIRATFFYRENIDYLTGGSAGTTPRNRRSGASLVYRKEFDSFTQLFSGKNKKGEKLKKEENKISNQE